MEYTGDVLPGVLIRRVRRRVAEDSFSSTKDQKTKTKPKRQVSLLQAQTTLHSTTYREKKTLPARDAGVQDALPPRFNPHHHPEAEGVGSADRVLSCDVLLPPSCIRGARHEAR